MKKNFYLITLSLLTLLFASCSSEEEVLGGAGSNAKNKVTFVLPMAKGAVTYAIANSNENKLDVANMKIYMVDASDVVEKTFSGQDIGAGTSGSNATATIFIPENISGNKTFYFVGNTETTIGTLTASTVVDGTTTLAQLIAIKTDNQAAPAHLSSANGLLLTGKSATVDINATPSVTVSLKRRVARLDIENVAAATGVTIKKINISNANRAGYAFADNDPALDPSVITGHLSQIDYPTLTNANIGRDESVTYLYPTKVGGITSIQIVGTVGAAEKLFTVKTVDILPNKRYTLKVKDASSFLFELVVEDWEEGGDIPAENSAGMSISLPVIVSGNGIINAGNSYVISDNTAGKFNFTVYAQSSEGVAVLKEDILGAFSTNINVTLGTVGPITYAAAKGYPQLVTVDVAAYTGTEDILSYIKFKDLSASNLSTTVRVYYSKVGSEYYPGTNLKPVTIGGYVWAPVNVGASTNVTTTLNIDLTGYHFQFGRNIPFNTFASSIETVAGPLSIADANATTKFITATMDANWSTEDNTNFWYASQNNHPCPTGWKVPSSTEFMKIQEKATADGISVTVDKNSFIVLADDGLSSIYLPFAGSIHGRNAAPNQFGQIAVYWTSQNSNPAQNIYSWQHLFSETKGAEKFAAPRVACYSVRCMKI